MCSGLIFAVFVSAILLQLSGFGFPPGAGLTEQYSITVFLCLKEKERKEKRRSKGTSLDLHLLVLL